MVTYSQTGTTIGKRLLSDEIYSVVRIAILSGELAPGERVVESEVARRFGVSQAPVREAVKRLAQEGLLTYRPRRGNFVSVASDEEMRDARDVRASMESLAASVTCGNLTATQITSLRDIVDRMHVAVANQSFDAFRELDVLFHTAVVEATGNSVLRRVWEMLMPSFRASRVVSDPFYQGNRDVIANEHGWLVDLLESGESQVAIAEFARHAKGLPPERPIDP